MDINILISATSLMGAAICLYKAHAIQYCRGENSAN